MTSPVQRVRPKCQAAAIFHMSPRLALWQILACAFLLATGLVGADGRKVAFSKGDPSDDLAIAEQLKEAFDVGFQVGPRSAQEAQERLARVRRLAPGEPRIDYSHGLVLVRQSQLKLAVVQFEAAVTQEGPPLWPAWKAAIWSQLIDKRYEPGLNRLVEFAILVHDSGNPDSPAGERSEENEREISEVQRDAARWIGQLLEALAGLPDARKHKGLIEERQSRVLGALGDELSLSFEEGRELLRARALELELAADAARDTAGQIAKRRKLDKELDALSKDKGLVPKTKEEWKKWIDDILAQVDKQLGQMDRDFKTFKQRADGLERSYVQADTQLTTLKTSMSMSHHPGNHIASGLRREQLVACNDQMLAYQLEYHLVVEQMSDVAQRASRIADRRVRAIARYEMETGDTIKMNLDLDKWATRLNAKRPKLTAKSVAKTVKKDATDRKRPATLKSLMPLDLEHERDDVLASFGLRRAAPADVPNLGEKPDAKSNERSATPAEK